MAKSDYLFSNANWHDVTRNQHEKLKSEVAEIEGNRLLNTSVDDLSDYFVKKYQVNVPVLDHKYSVAEQNEVQVDISGDWNRHIIDRSKPHFIAGTEIRITVPFSGDKGVFGVQPTTFSLNPPRARVGNTNLSISISGTQLDPASVKNEIKRTLDSIDENLERLRSSADQFNSGLAEKVRSQLENRRKKLLRDQNLVASLGFRLKERPETPQTYCAPEVRRKIRPQLPPAGNQPFEPEPTLGQGDYTHILEIIESMVLVMERSPSAFSDLDEEALRSHFLVQLNGHYEGQATGETFNYQGKTDILIRVKDKNIFIAECKFWDGPKKMVETIDQILGYSSWRDTKVAIIVFNRNKDFTRVLASIKGTTKQHENCKREIESRSETSSRFLFSHRNDPNREMVLTTLAFDVPSLEN